MIRSAVTVSLVSEARGGPFVYWDDLPAACRSAAALGFDAIELFAPSPTEVSEETLRGLLEGNSLRLAAVGTGAGMVRHGLSLIDRDPERRDRAVAFVRDMIDYGGPFQAPAIVGSMQGRWDAELPRDKALSRLAESLARLGEHAAQYSVPLIYEPLNRYETNLINTMADGVDFLTSHDCRNVRLLADLFHMNIEEADVAAGVRAGGSRIGHIHFVDSNRRAAGMGHTNFGPLAEAIREIGYDGFASAEAFPIPDSEAAARQTITAFREAFPRA